MHFTDQTGHRIILENPPERIVSLVPSQTELLADLRLVPQLVGITKFCVHPQELLRSKKVIGGTKQLHLEGILGLSPDLIIANKEENRREDVEFLREHFPVWTSDVSNLSDALEMIEQIGAMTNRHAESAELADSIRQQFDLIAPPNPRPKTLYLIWQNPYMAAGNNTFIHHMLQRAGFDNTLHQHPRYPTLSIEAIVSMNPEVLLLSSEPYPFGPKHQAFFQQLLPSTKVILVDGEFFSWYGSRLRYSVPYFNALLQNLNA